MRRGRAIRPSCSAKPAPTDGIVERATASPAARGPTTALRLFKSADVPLWLYDLMVCRNSSGTRSFAARPPFRELLASDCLQVPSNYSAACVNGQCYLTCPSGSVSCPYSQGCFTFDSNAGPISLCTP